MPRKKEMSFESALERLENIVESMETGETSLAELLKNYSEGVELSKFCMASLDRTEQAMDLLIKENGGSFKEQKLDIEGE
ncbi:MAG TPA: exodeoxyribonuclease VII small subunit [Selenomonas sp.]|nr:exodeoxyribonuclease VII small subunit [Selenomonadaceae bacterium]HCB92886.1 exodeoxyribonuclease VII small subunit [Selenomonas sp.]